MEGGTVGRILSYYDLCDVKYPRGVDKDMDFSEFMTEEEIEEAELKRIEREEEEKIKKEEEERVSKEEERKEKEAEEERIKTEKLRQIQVYFHEESHSNKCTYSQIFTIRRMKWKKIMVLWKPPMNQGRQMIFSKKLAKEEEAEK